MFRCDLQIRLQVELPNPKYFTLTKLQAIKNEWKDSFYLSSKCKQNDPEREKAVREKKVEGEQKASWTDFIHGFVFMCIKKLSVKHIHEILFGLIFIISFI
jgi:hypothetical protein